MAAGSTPAKDNRAIEARADVPTFTASPLTEDVQAIGPVPVRPPQRSDDPHVDHFTRVCDVDPRAGRSTCATAASARGAG
ncbi:hypothetical protein ABT340_19070 [Streptosporangium sp. NPDC000239]|uniref:hypothetical protein n=1 Tax=Streptosporangium sp. NPDC000239 TaxID=3154248 RepID=UPI003330B884